MNTPPVIRDATPDDAPVVARIYIDSWNAGFGDLMPFRTLDAERVERWRRDLSAPLPHRWWVAAMASEIVGFAGIGPSRDPIDPELGELDTIAIDPTHLASRRRARTHSGGRWPSRNRGLPRGNRLDPGKLPARPALLRIDELAARWGQPGRGPSDQLSAPVR